MNVRVLLVAISCAGVASAGLASDAEIDPRREPVEYRLPGNPTIDTQGPDRIRIGVRLRAPLDGALRAHLGLEEGEGILVDGVIADSPAARAGLQTLDVIVQVDGAAVNDTASFARALRSSDGQPVLLEIVRRGRRQRIEVEPQVYPAAIEVVVSPDRRRVFSYDELRLPGVFFDSSAVALPSNVEVQLTKRGAEPAQLRAQRDERTWQLSEHELDQLPDDLREQVQRLFPGLAGPARPAPARLNVNIPAWNFPAAQSGEVAPQLGTPDDTVWWELGFARRPREEDALDKVLRQLEILTERISKVEAALRE